MKKIVLPVALLAMLAACKSNDTKKKMSKATRNCYPL